MIVGPLQVRPHELALVEGRALYLPRKQLELLTAFALNENRVLDRARLAEQAWGTAREEAGRTVDYTVLKLRRRLEEALPGWEFIHTHVGLGYRFSAERSQGFHNTGTRP